MQQVNNFIVLNIREYLENDDGRLGEDNGIEKINIIRLFDLRQ